MKQRYSSFGFMALVACLFMPISNSATAASLFTPVPPEVRVGIGMSVRDLQLGSTYAFPVRREAKGNRDSDVFSISVPYTLKLVDDNKTLILNDIGGENFFTAIAIASGKVDLISVTPQSEKLSIETAMALAQKLLSWFEERGYVSDRADSPITIVRANGTEPSQSIRSLAEVRTAMVDTRTKIEEVQLFSLVKGHLGLGLTLTNQRRMRARYNRGYDIETRVASEKVYYLNLVVTDIR